MSETIQNNISNDDTSSVGSNDITSFSLPKPSELVKDTEKTISERKVHFEKAYSMAVEHILKKNESLALKMKNDAQSGRFRTILYSFTFNDTRDAEVDNDNNVIRFDGVYLRDMCMKGNKLFFEKLTNTFNSNSSEKKYRCYFYFDKKTKKYHIYVSWGDKNKYYQNNIVKPVSTIVQNKFKPREMNNNPPPFNKGLPKGGRGGFEGRGGRGPNNGGRGPNNGGRGGFEGRGGRGPNNGGRGNIPPKKKNENMGNK